MHQAKRVATFEVGAGGRGGRGARQGHQRAEAGCRPVTGCGRTPKFVEPDIWLILLGMSKEDLHHGSVNENGENFERDTKDRV